MVKTIMALLVLGSVATAQDRPQEPPRRPEPPPPPVRPVQPPREPRPPLPPVPPDGGRGERGMQAPFNPEEVRSWLKDNEPETHRRLMAIQGEGRREDVMRILAEAVPRMREMNEMKQRDPKGYEKVVAMRRLERESLEQAEAARRASAEDREAAVQKLKETLGRLFDAREEVRARELAELKRRVETLEKAVTDRKTSKERIVEKRRRELMGEKSDEDW